MFNIFLIPISDSATPAFLQRYVLLTKREVKLAGYWPTLIEQGSSVTRPFSLADLRLGFSSVSQNVPLFHVFEPNVCLAEPSVAFNRFNLTSKFVNIAENEIKQLGNLKFSLQQK